jgi:hypothetical protein
MIHRSVSFCYHRVVQWIASWPAWVLVIGWLLLLLAVAIGGVLFVQRIVPVEDRSRVPSLASPLMPALGATFAVLAAITLSSEAGYLKSAQDDVSNEAAAASRLAWAATSPDVNGGPVHSALQNYLVSTRRFEWSQDDAERDSDPATADALAALERTVRSEAARTELGTPASTELLASLDSLTSARRTRLAAAERTLPALYVMTLIISGLALVANAGALVASVARRSMLLISGLAVVVALCLALLFAITGPFRGPLAVSGQPIDRVVDDLQSGFFSTG